MIESFYCVNVFTKNTKELIEFYHEKLGIPIQGTLDDDTNGVNLGFTPEAPKICIWDADKTGSPVQGTVSFVFMCKNLDETCDELTQKGMTFPPPVRYEWGTYELRLRDPDDNEVVVVERF
ncbi:VOC family protein [Candidatus Bathyarchaeota archaeon]|nr:VOC family protein [Candidatus Bathyarchaeota archaeon]